MYYRKKDLPCFQGFILTRARICAHVHTHTKFLEQQFPSSLRIHYFLFDKEVLLYKMHQELL